MIKNRDPAETTTYLIQNEVRPGLYVSVIQLYCQAEYGGITQESRAASDRLDRAFPAPLSPSLMASMQVPHRQAAAAAPDAAPHRQAAAAQAKTAPKAAARRQASERPRGTVATSMASAAAAEEPQSIRPQRRRIRGISGVSSTESASSPADFPGAPVFDSETDRQADPVVKTEGDLQEDSALAASLNTALPGRHEDDREVAATQEDEEEDEEDEGEEEEDQQDDEEEEVAPRQAQVAPPPQEGVVDQGAVISGCLAAQARARGSENKGAKAIAAAASACVFSLFLTSTRHARRCRSFLVCSTPSSFRTRTGGLTVRQHGALFLLRCMCLPLLLAAVTDTGNHLGSCLQSRGLRQTEAPVFTSPITGQGYCQTGLPSMHVYRVSSHSHPVTGTSGTLRPGARHSMDQTLLVSTDCGGTGDTG